MNTGSRTSSDSEPKDLARADARMALGGADKRWRRGVVVALLALVGPALGTTDAQSRFQHIDAAKKVVAVRTRDRIIADGQLDEPAWKLAGPATDFVQQQPNEGGPATEPSEVRFVYDEHSLYVSGVFHDSDPVNGPITNELKRDFSINDGDLVALTLDTLRDRRNSFNFMTNPAGAQYDSQSYDDGRQINQNWDGVWFVETSRFDKGWTMEMEIPFKTLRFPEQDAQEWGVNVFRLIRRKNESTSWSQVPRQFTQFKISYAGTLTGISGIRPPRNMRIKPFATSQVSHGLKANTSGWRRRSPCSSGRSSIRRFHTVSCGTSASCARSRT